MKITKSYKGNHINGSKAGYSNKVLTESIKELNSLFSNVKK